MAISVRIWLVAVLPTRLVSSAHRASVITFSPSPRTP